MDETRCMMDDESFLLSQWDNVFQTAVGVSCEKCCQCEPTWGKAPYKLYPKRVAPTRNRLQDFRTQTAPEQSQGR